jgi:hypothetical protein
MMLGVIEAGNRIVLFARVGHMERVHLRGLKLSQWVLLHRGIGHLLNVLLLLHFVAMR